MKTLVPWSLVACGVVLAACGGGGDSGPGDIGGTGKSFVRGPVTGFGSVIVNGVTYQTGSAEFEIDDDNGSQDDLEIGQIVEIQARGNVATMIRYDAEVEGPIDSIDAANNRFTAVGVTVLIEGTTVFENASLETLVAGDFVEVSGEFDANGNLHAAFVERDDSGAGEVEVKGTVAAHDPALQQFTLNNLTVDYSGATLDPSSLVISNGQFVEAEGLLNGGVLVATEIELEDRDDDFEAGDEAEIEGFVSEVLSSSEFTLRGVTVRHDGATEFEGGSASNIAPNVRLEVEGEIDASGVLVAEEIEFDDEDRRELSLAFEGPAQSSSSNSVSLLGITVQTRTGTVVRDERDDNDELRVSGIQPGDYIRVRAFVDDGVLVAGRIERDESEETVQVAAFLDSEDEAADLIVVQGITVDVSGASFEADDEDVDKSGFYATAMPGDFVEVEGLFDGNLVIADEVELGDD